MDRRWKSAERAVSALGVLGLALSGLYLFAVAISFHPRGAKFSEFMVGTHEGEFGWALPAVVVPYVVLLAYLWARSRLAHWMVEKGAVEAALEYTQGRLDASLLRSRAEVTSHRAARAKALLRSNRAEEAMKVGSVHDNVRSSVGRELRYWKAVAALRRDDLVDAKKVLGDTKRKRGRWAGELYLVGAEIAVREGELEAYRAALADAEWAGAEPHRIAWARAVGVAKFELTGEAESSFEELQRWGDRLDEEVPGRAGERLLIASRIAELIGNEGGVRDLMERAQNLRLLDRRSDWLVREQNPEVAGAS